MSRLFDLITVRLRKAHGARQLAIQLGQYGDDSISLEHSNVIIAVGNSAVLDDCGCNISHKQSSDYGCSSS